jgi:hypothetical protein
MVEVKFNSNVNTVTSFVLHKGSKDISQTLVSGWTSYLPHLTILTRFPHQIHPSLS